LKLLPAKRKMDFSQSLLFFNRLRIFVGSYIGFTEKARPNFNSRKKNQPTKNIKMRGVARKKSAKKVQIPKNKKRQSFERRFVIGDPLRIRT